MICPDCGRENKPGAVFCASCSARLPAPGAGTSEEGGDTLSWIGEKEGGKEAPVERADRKDSPRGYVFGDTGLERGVIEDVDERRESDYYVPPEMDYTAAATTERPAPAQEPYRAAEMPPAGQDSTQAIAPALGVAAAEAPRPRKICPECYAPNPEQNMYCQECGSALPVITARQAASRDQASPAGYQQTAVMPAGMIEDAGMPPAYAQAGTGAGKARTARSLGVADVLAVLSIGAVAMALVPAFTWKKGIELGIFSHQGAYSQGRADLLGGPGILPYSGVEFFTVGLVAAVGAGLALVFLAVRAGRGPMYILAGSILLFPLVYLFFQAVLPLRQMGINVQPSPGLGGIFFGNAANPGLGPPLWLISGAGLLLLLAGFMAPPRGWGRLLTFVLCFSLILGAAFFCAASYNWNLFISDADIGRGRGGFLSAFVPSVLSALLH